MAQYDVTVIGSGPGGYYNAIRAAQLGFKVAIIEKYNTLGGTCLNVGCIPSKALLDSSHLYYDAIHEFPEHGIQVEDKGVDFHKMIERKRQVVKQTCDGISFLMKKNKIDVYTGVGHFQDAQTIEVTADDGSKTPLTTRYTVVATGSKPSSLPGMEIDKKRIISSTEVLELQEIPERMIVIGGGYIGLEMGSVYNRLGTKIDVLEYADRLIPNMEQSLAKELKKVLKKQGMQLHLKTKVTGVQNHGDKVTVTATDKNGKEQTFEGDYCLMATGRKAYTQNLGLENIGIQTDSQGKIPVNANLETDVPGVYAIGDVVAGPMLAHKAEEEGAYVAEVIAGERPHINYNLIPEVIYTWPEVASVGYKAYELDEKGIAYKTGSFPYRASGRARASNDPEGEVKVFADENTDEILGMHMIGPRASDMIGEGVIAMEYRASAEDIARMTYAHPTFTEAIKEACMAATADRAIHI